MLLRSCVAPPAQLVGTAELLAAAWTALTSVTAAASGSPGRWLCTQLCVALGGRSLCMVTMGIECCCVLTSDPTGLFSSRKTPFVSALSAREIGR